MLKAPTSVVKIGCFGYCDPVPLLWTGGGTVYLFDDGIREYELDEDLTIPAGFFANPGVYQFIIIREGEQIILSGNEGFEVEILDVPYAVIPGLCPCEGIYYYDGLYELPSKADIYVGWDVMGFMQPTFSGKNDLDVFLQTGWEIKPQNVGKGNIQLTAKIGNFLIPEIPGNGDIQIEWDIITPFSLTLPGSGTMDVMMGVYPPLNIQAYGNNDLEVGVLIGNEIDELEIPGNGHVSMSAKIGNFVADLEISGNSDITVDWELPYTLKFFITPRSTIECEFDIRREDV